MARWKVRVVYRATRGGRLVSRTATVDAMGEAGAISAAEHKVRSSIRKTYPAAVFVEGNIVERAGQRRMRL